MQKNRLEGWQDINQVYIPPLETSGWTADVLKRDIWERNWREENEKGMEEELPAASEPVAPEFAEQKEPPEEQKILQPDPVLESVLEQEEEHTVLLTAKPAVQQAEEDCTVLLASQEVEEKVYLVRINTNERIDLNGESFTIGKSAKADYQIQGNDAISRKHIQITKNDDGYWLEDLQSLNHTYIEDREIEDPVKLENGQNFKIADEELSFHIEKLEQ